MNSDWIHFLATAIWGVYSIVIGVVAITSQYISNFVWISIIVAITGNSAHLVTFAYSKGKILVQSTGQVGKPPSTTGTTQ